MSKEKLYYAVDTVFSSDGKERAYIVETTDPNVDGGRIGWVWHETPEKAIGNWRRYMRTQADKFEEKANHLRRLANSRVRK